MGGFRNVGDYLVSSSTAVLLPNDGKGLHHSYPFDPCPSSTHAISNTPAHSATDSTTGDDSSATHQPSSTCWTCGSLGPPIRRTGAAESTTAVGSRSLPSHMIAMLVSQIGWRVGLWPRRLGAAAMKARAAHQQLAGVLRSRAEMPWQRFCCKVISQV